MSGRFESLLERHQAERHWRILAGLARARRDPPVDDGIDGFLPAGKAAVVMQVSEVELLDLASRGVLDWRDIGGAVWVRPAVVRIVIGARNDAA